MKRSLLLALIVVICSLNANSQCTPVDCPNSPNLLPFGGICDTIIPSGVVNQPYSESTSFRVTNVCFNPSDFDPTLPNITARITSLNNFSFGGLPTGVTATTNQPATPPAADSPSAVPP